MTTDKNKLTPEAERELAAIDAALAGSTAEPELSELGRLALELRDERPEPDPFFTRDLDARAAAGFPRPRPSGAKWRRFSPTLAMGAAASVLIAVVVATSVINPISERNGSSNVMDPSEESANGGADSDAGAGRAATPAERRAAKRAKSPQVLLDESAGAGGGSVAAPSPPPGGGSPNSDRRQARKVETSASLTLTAPPRKIPDVADGVVRVTDALGGFVISSTVSSTDGEDGGGLFEIRVPSAKLQNALAELSKLAHVQARQQSSQDITAQSVSASDRLQDARAERTALLRRLAKAATTAEIDSLKARLRRVSARIATAKADLARVNNRASFSNIAVSLAADPNAGEPGDDEGTWSPGDAARDAVRVLEVIAGVALIALAVGVPLALLVTLLAVAARLATRRRRERALDAV